LTALVLAAAMVVMIWVSGNTPTTSVLLMKLATSIFHSDFHILLFVYFFLASYQAKNQECSDFNTCGTCSPGTDNCNVVTSYKKYTVGDYGEVRGADQIKSEV
jgi:hypothetical protein